MRKLFTCTLQLMFAGVPAGMARAAENNVPVPAAESVKGRAAADTIRTRDPLPTGYDGANINLHVLDKAGLQAIMDSLVADDCRRPDGIGCRWRVLSLDSRRASEADQPVNLPPADVQATAPEHQSGRQTEQQTDRFSSRIPAGFEQLAARQSDEIEVFVDNSPVIRTGITYDTASFNFDNPFAVTEAIAGAGIPDRRGFEEFVLLDHPIEKSDLCIGPDGPFDCLTREPSAFAFVPDMEALRIDLIIRDRGDARGGNEIQRLAPATRSLSYQANARAAAVAISSQGTAADAAVSASISYGQGGLFGSTSYSSTDEQLRLNDLFLAHQFADHQLQLGTLDYFSNGLLLNQPLLGLRWNRSLNTYVNRYSLFVTPILVDLERRAVVQLVVNGVVRSSETLDPGPQELNTRSLPGGTYEVEIRIRDAEGVTTRTEFFSRASVLPPPDLPQYAFTVASSLDDRDTAAVPVADGNVFIQGEVLHRIGSRSAARVEATHHVDTSVAQLQLIQLGERYQLQMGALTGEHSARGGAVQAAWRGDSVSVSARGLRFESDRDQINDPALDRFLRPDTTRIGASLNYRFDRYTLNLSADRFRESIAGVSRDRDRYVAHLQRRLATGALRGSTIGVRFVDDNDQQHIDLRLTVFGQDDDVSHRGSLAYERRLAERSGEFKVNYSAVWEPDSIDLDTQQRWSGRLDTSASATRARVGITTRYVGRTVDLGLTTDVTDVASSDALESDDLTWRAQLTAGAQIASDGTRVASGRPGNNTSGVIIDVNGEPRGEVFDILVNGQRRDTGEIGRPRFIGLPAFRTHEIQLVPRSLTFGNFNESAEAFTLYPGNVHTVDVDIENRYLLVTSLVLASGERVSEAVLTQGDEPYFIMADGIVQLEVRPLDLLDVDLGDGRRCQVQAPDPGDEDIVIQSEPLLCLE